VRVRKGVQVRFGGTREITGLIWGYARDYRFDLGYASTKRLRTPELDYLTLLKKNLRIVFIFLNLINVFLTKIKAALQI
jgi:hypothetical protein